MVGVDIDPQPNFPFEFIQADALEVLADTAFVSQFDALHGSPPCQAYSTLRHRTGKTYPDLVDPTRKLFQASGLPYVIENVVGSPLVDPTVLCGTHFDLQSQCRDGEARWLKRHRLFETPFTTEAAGKCFCRQVRIGGVYGTGGGGQMTRGYKFYPEEARAAMGIDWMTRAEIAEAIPPVYAEHIGGFLMAEVLARREAAA